MLVTNKNEYKKLRKEFVPKKDMVFGTNRPYPTLYFNDDKCQIFTYKNLNWKKSELINYDDIIKIVGISDLQDKNGHPLLGATAGSVLFGGVGAVIGAVAGSGKAKGIINKLEIDIYLKDNTVSHIELIKTKVPQKTTSSIGKQAIADYDNWKAKLDEIVNLNEINTSSKNNNNNNINNLKQLKELADEGIITQEEFEAKKKKILELE